MTWDEMTKEILTDIVKILGADRSAQYIVGIIQWQGKIVARSVYQPSIIELVGDGGLTTGMSMMPEPPSGWTAVELNFVPKADGKPSKADVPLAYYVDSEKGNGVAFPARYHNDKGHVTWSHNPEIIEHIGDRLLVAGLLELKNQDRVLRLVMGRLLVRAWKDVWEHRNELVVLKRDGNLIA